MLDQFQKTTSLYEGYGSIEMKVDITHHTLSQDHFGDFDNG